MRTTIDTLMDGAVVLEQPAPGEGYRFNVDAVLLARFAARGPVGHLMDLGSGVGAVALCVARLTRVERATLVEVDPVSCELARRNAARADLKAEVVEGDVAGVGGAAELIVCNPPYSAPHAGRASPVRGRDVARRGSVKPFLEASARLLVESGRACFCYPVVSLTGLLASAQGAGLRATRIAFVHPSLDKPARIALVEFRTSGELELEGAVVG